MSSRTRGAPTVAMTMFKRGTRVNFAGINRAFRRRPTDDTLVAARMVDLVIIHLHGRDRVPVTERRCLSDV